MYKKAVIVLGCGIDAEGRLGDDPMNAVKLGIEAAELTSDTCLIMAGCVSYKADFRLSISEAQAMKDYAVTLGFAADRVFVETESKDTIGNLVFTKQNLLQPLRIHDTVIVRGPNQSTERISYLARKVLGGGISFRIIEPNIDRPDEQAREQRSLAVARQWLDSITDGDDRAIYALMRARHPGYNSAISIETIRTLF